jgi:hypothetical protein
MVRKIISTKKYGKKWYEKSRRRKKWFYGSHPILPRLVTLCRMVLIYCNGDVKIRDFYFYRPIVKTGCGL